MRYIENRGKALKDELKKRGLKQGFVATKIGAAQNSFDAFLNDRRPMPEPILRAALALISIDPDLWLSSQPTQQHLPLKEVANG